MRYKKLGRTGLLVSEICLGTMTFGGQGAVWSAMGDLQERESEALVKTAFDARVNFFDTANVYSNGESERLLGAAIKNLGLARDEIVVATKAFGRVTPNPSGANPSAAETAHMQHRAAARNISGLSRKHLFDAVDKSLTRLGTDYIDLYQIHGFDPLTPLEETLEALDDIVRSGRVRYIGLCNLAAWQIAKAIGISTAKGLARFESLQMYYSIVGRELEREIVPLAEDQELAILPWSPLAGGFLSGKYSREGAGSAAGRRAKFDFPPVDLERGYNIIDAMRDIGQRMDASPARLSLAWLLHQKAVTSVIIGARTPDQLDDNLKAIDVRLSADDLARLDEVSKIPVEYPGWMLDWQGRDRRGQI